MPEEPTDADPPQQPEGAGRLRPPLTEDERRVVRALVESLRPRPREI